uniref:ATP synthase subunit a n=1 Tax=Araneae sp. MT-2014 TaxID=1560008 RepID=A0A0A0S103_9ARAC|nr:ATP synthase F0 subunit 6 [Araneae sp. MT-2014]
MMMNLFSVFDPTSYFGLSLNWIILLIVLIIIPSKYYTVSGGYSSIMGMLKMQVTKMFMEVSFPNYMVMCYVCVVTFLYLIFSNLLGLLPFVFTETTHPMFTLGLGLVFWMSFFLMGWIKNFKHSAAHLVPEGSPLMLSPLMVIIESVSHLIRPFTLSIRLAANMMAGHLIIGLLASISLINVYSFFVSMLLQSVLMVLEFGVAIIQGFVFSILLLLYALEYY